APEVARAAVSKPAEQTKSRRVQIFFMDSLRFMSRLLCASEVRRPALLIFAPPQLHCLGIVLNVPVLRIQMQFALNLPGDIGKLQHRNGDVAVRDGSAKFFAASNRGYKVGEVSVGHRVAPYKIGRGSLGSNLEFAG